MTRAPGRALPLLGALWLLVAGCGETDAGTDAPALGVATCTADIDCAGLDDGNDCNGRVRCDPGDGQCRFDPATVVACDAGADTPCAVNRCEPSTGACALQPRSGGLPCDDGEPCTYGDHCEDGACTAGKTDLCACHTDADCPSDGDACNGQERCDTKVFPYRCGVVPGSVVVCDPAKGPCLQNVCEPNKGTCVAEPLADGLACDDGENCTTADHCAAGACVGDPAPDVSGCPCLGTDDCVDDDGDACTGVPFCSKAEGAGSSDPGVCKTNPATVVVCSSEADSACSKNACDPATGTCAMSPVADETGCDDGNPCTTGEVCIAGACAAGTDICACKTDADCKDKEDGDLCNGTLFCNKQSGACEVNPATTVACATVGDTDCSKNVCEPKTGACAALPRAEVALVGCVDIDLGGLVGKQCLWKKAAEPGKGPFLCDDGSICTTGEVCEGKTCGGGKVVCECAVDADCPDKDGDVCNGVPYCDKATGACKPDPNSVVYCSKKDDTACLAAVCDPKTGNCALAPTAKGTPCDDGKLCTADDACDASGTCVGAYACDDGDKCTFDYCTKLDGCVHFEKKCNDGNVCTSEACEPSTGACKTGTPLADTTPCNADGSGCTVGDHCNGQGACIAGPTATCKDPGVACTIAACKSTGVQTFECISAQAKDGSPCDDGDPCFEGSSCKGGTCAAGKQATISMQVVASATKETSHQAFCAVGGEDGSVALLSRQVLGGVLRWHFDVRPAFGFVSTIKDLALPPAAGDTLSDPVALVPQTEGGWLLIGNGTDKNGLHPLFLPVDDTGKPGTWIDCAKVGTAPTRVLAAAHHPSGNLVMVLRVGDGSADNLVVTMVGIDGVALWTQTVGPASGATTQAKMLVLADGDIVVAAVGKGADGGGVRNFASFTASGDQQWNVVRSFPKKFKKIAGMFELQPGLVTLLMTGETSGTRWLVIHVKTGALQPQTRVVSATFAPTLARRHGPWVFAAQGTASGTTIVRYDSLGNVQATFSVPHGDAMGLIDMTIDAVHQRLVPVYDWLADATVYGAQRVALYRPTSFHGALSCQGRGACADKTLEACDDGKPCTADDCSPLAGCIHTPKGVGLCPSSSGCSKHGSCDAGTCTEPEYGRVFVHSLADLVDAPQKIEGRVTRTPDPELGHAWTWTVVGGDLLLQGWELSLSTGTANEGGPPTIRCTGLTGVADIRRRPNGEIIAYGPYTDSKYAHGAALCIAAVGWQPATAKTPIFDGAVVKVVNGTASSIHEPRGISLHTNGDLLAVWNSSKQGGTMFMRRFDVNLKQLFNSDYDSSLVVAVKAVVSGAYGDSYAVGRLGDEGPSQFPFLLRRASASDAKEQVDLKELAGGAFLDAAVAGKDIIAVGTTIHTAAARSTLATRIDTDNKLIWIHGPAIPDQGELAGVVAVEDGYVAVGTRIVGGPRNLMAVRRTEAGQTLWQRTHAYDNGIDVEATVSSLVRTEAGGFLFGAKRVAEGTPLWVHISAHGYFTCDGAGACASPTQACDDKDPCTADYCDAAAGCKHAAITGCKAP